MPKKRKRKATKQQLKNLAKGRAKRAANIKKRKRSKPKTKTITKVIYKKRPMAKRRRTSTNNLTGGSGDVNPQLYSGTISTTVADQPITNAMLAPISRLPKTGGRVAVMEILKIWAWLYPNAAIANVAETAWSISLNFGTKDHGIIEAFPNDAQSFAHFEYRQYGAFTAGGTLRDNIIQPHTVDLTDGMGHGVLVASDYFYAQLDTDGFAVVNKAYFKILYRIKNVALTEYIGIVQSQQ